jgi:hypothetical protein
MTKIDPPTGHVMPVDPGIPTIFMNGPINIMSTGDLVFLTFTDARPNLSETMAGIRSPRYQATVVARLAMPRAAAVQLAQLLARQLIATASTAGQLSEATPNSEVN